MIPCNRDPDLRRDLRAAILEEVTSTELRLRSLYTQLNALAPVSLLPTELLARIFHLYRDDENNYTNARLLLSVAVSHVCRRWREVAFGDPSLWGEIRNTVPRCNQRWLTEMLTHPTNVPLDIRLHGPHTDRLLHSLTRHSSRISRLSLLGLKDGDAVQALLEMEAPVLEDLHMEISTTARWPTVVSHDPAFPTGGFRLFHRQSSELRKIYLYNIHVPWAYFPTCTLTHLEIIFEPPDTAELPQLENLDDLVDVIASSPCLERLTLDHCIAPVFSQSSLLAETVIELPRLRELSLSGHSSGVLRIFQSLHAPVLRSLALIFLATSQAEVESWPTATPSILSRFHRTGSVTIKALRFEVYGDCGETKVEVEGYSSSVDPAIPSSPLDETFASLDFQVHLPEEVQNYHEILWPQACTALHMAELESIYVTLPLPATADLPWTQLFDQCTNVTKVHAQGARTKSFLWSMGPHDPTPPVSLQDPHAPVPALLFPKMAYLSLEDLDFNFSHNAERVCGLVIKLVEHRERCGAPVGELFICNCDISSAEAASLESLVPKVGWERDDMY